MEKAKKDSVVWMGGVDGRKHVGDELLRWEGGGVGDVSVGEEVC